MAPPHISREKQSARKSAVPRRLDHVAGAHAGGEQALVRVAHRGVGDEQLLLREHPLGDGLRPLGVEQVLEAHLRRDLARGHGVARGGVLAALRVRVLDLEVRDVAQDARGPVAGVRDVEELRRLVDELGVAAAVYEGGVVQDVRDEGDVGLDAADVLLVDGAARLAADGSKVRSQLVTLTRRES